jgi:hypothetical protein
MVVYYKCEKNLHSVSSKYISCFFGRSVEEPLDTPQKYFTGVLCRILQVFTPLRNESSFIIYGFGFSRKFLIKAAE